MTAYRYRPRYTLTDADLGREWETTEQGVVRIDGWDQGKVTVVAVGTHPPVTARIWRKVVEARIDSGMWLPIDRTVGGRLGMGS